MIKNSDEIIAEISEDRIMSMTVRIMLWIVAACIFGAGGYQLITHKLIGKGDMDKQYTEESLEKFAKYQGILFLVLALGIAAIGAGDLVAFSVGGFKLTTVGQLVALGALALDILGVRGVLEEQ